MPEAGRKMAEHGRLVLSSVHQRATYHPAGQSLRLARRPAVLGPPKQRVMLTGASVELAAGREKQRAKPLGVR
jgi:hypothetical protein